MKQIITAMLLLFIMVNSYSQNNEKRIKFNNGTLKICTSSNMKITGYDGDEVIIKSLTNNNHRVLYNNLNTFPRKTKISSISGDTITLKGNVRINTNTDSIVRNRITNKIRYFVGNLKEKELEKGLTPLGTKSTNPADNLYLDIEEKPGELIIKDYVNKTSGIATVNSNLTTFHFNDKYELLVPNSINLLWNVENCQKTKTNTNTFVVRSSSNPWELSNFKGDVEISSSYSSVSLTDVSGSVLVNTLGGNIKVIFDKSIPKRLYSLISNDGYIDVKLPNSSDVNINARGSRILSDIDFKILQENIVQGNVKEMKLQLNKGNVKMKFNSGSGNIYLRKK